MKKKPYQRHRAILMPMIFSLLIAGTAAAKPLDISNKVWVTRDSAEQLTVPPDEDDASNMTMFKATLPGGIGSNPDTNMAKIESFFNPSYQFYPYVAIFDSLDRKSVSVITDGGIRATLVPVAGQDGVYDIVGSVVYPAAKQGSQPAAAHTLGRISTADAHCVVYKQDKKPCFVFIAMTPELTLSFGGYVHLYDRWQDMRETPATEQSEDQQTYGNIFVAYPENFNFVRTCYDITKMDFTYLVRTGCTNPIFSDLSADTKNYQKITIDDKTVALPWGWTRIAANITTGEGKTRSLDTASELQRSMNTSVGFNAKASIFGATAESHLSVGVKEKLDEMRENKTSNSSYDYLMTDHAFILNRTNARLSDEFTEAVKSLVIDKDYDGFIRHWGTHYAYATTFGQRSHRTLMLTESQSSKAIESGIDIDAGMKVGYKAMGQGGEAGFDVKIGEDQLNKIHNIAGEESESVVCYGGGSCDQGHLDGNARIPVQVDLRPISELLGPPFYKFPTDQDIYTRVHDELALAIAKKVFLSEEDSQQLGANGTKYIVVRATMTSTDGVDIASISKVDPKFELRTLELKFTPGQQWVYADSAAWKPRPSANTSGVWIFPYSTFEQSINEGDRFFPHVEAMTAKGFTCSGVQVAEGTVLFNEYIGLGLPPQENILGSDLDNYSKTYKVTASTSSASFVCPNLNVSVSIKIVNSNDELLAEVGTLQPREDNHTGNN